VDSCIRRVSGNQDLAPRNEAERAIGRLYNDLNYTTADAIIAGGLHEFLEDVEERCSQIGEAIRTTYLNY
jgi:uncharacterized alpha-E superfamily protein